VNVDVLKTNLDTVSGFYESCSALKDHTQKVGTVGECIRSLLASFPIRVVSAATPARVVSRRQTLGYSAAAVSSPRSHMPQLLTTHTITRTTTTTTNSYLPHRGVQVRVLATDRDELKALHDQIQSIFDLREDVDELMPQVTEGTGQTLPAHPPAQLIALHCSVATCVCQIGPRHTHWRLHATNVCTAASFGSRFHGSVCFQVPCMRPHPVSSRPRRSS
jgi:hypothetical protein